MDRKQTIGQRHARTLDTLRGERAFYMRMLKNDPDNRLIRDALDEVDAAIGRLRARAILNPDALLEKLIERSRREEK